MRRINPIVALIGILLALNAPAVIADSSNSNFSVILSDSFEGTRVVQVEVDTTISPTGSVFSNGVLVTGLGESESNVTISTAFNKYNEPGLLIEVEGGEVSIDVSSPQAFQAAVSQAIPEPATCPDEDDADYPIVQLCESFKSYLVDIDLYLPPVRYDAVDGARIPPGTNISEEFEQQLFRVYFIRQRDVFQVTSSCSSWDGCTEEPVMFIHGYQGEPFRQLIKNNGGRDYWGQFPERLINEGFSTFEFKWHTNARFEDVAKDLKYVIENIKQRTGRSVHIVAHSMGGVLVREMLQGSHTKSVFSSIASVTTVGTPHLGIFQTGTNAFEPPFPKGQDEWTGGFFNICAQIVCHQLGENVFGSTIASLLGFDVEHGSVAQSLREGIYNLPPAKIQNLIGFALNFDQSVGVYSVASGDGLISGNGQRFDSNFIFEETGESNLLSNSVRGAATISEFVLGRSSSESEVDLYPGKVVTSDYFEPFKHSDPVFFLDQNLSYKFDEPKVGPTGEGFHDVFHRVLEWIGGESVPVGTSLGDNELITGSISTPGEEDEYTFTLNVGETIHIRVADISYSALWPKAMLYSPDGELLVSSVDVDVARITHLATQSGTYSLRIVDSLSSYTGDYNLYFVRVPGANEGGELPNGSSVFGTVDMGDIDSYTFPADVGNFVALRLVDLEAGDLWPEMWLYGPDGALLSKDVDASVASISYEISQTGVHTVLVNAGSFPKYSGTYDLYFVRIPGANEGGELINDGVISETIDAGDLDTYTFDAESGQSIALRVADTLSTSLWPEVSVFGPNGDLVASDVDQTVAVLSFVANQTGTYTVLVRAGAGLLQYYGDYNLYFVRIPGSNEGGELFNGDSKSGSIDLGDLDTYTFAANTGETVSLVLTDTESGMIWPGMSLFAPNGELLQQKSDQSEVSINFTATHTGVHTVMIYAGAGLAHYIGPYNLSFEKN